MSHEKPVAPFADLHVEDGEVTATLLHDPTVEGLDVALYLDGSSSMEEEYTAKSKRTFLEWLTGQPGTPLQNDVEPQAQWMLEYLATKDRNGLLRVAYWACGETGQGVEVLGELKGTEARQYTFTGPERPGKATCLEPAMLDYVAYFEDMAKAGAKQGCAVFITDGHLHDAPEVKRLSAQLAKRMAAGTLPRLNFILVGVGEDIDEEQLEDISHQEYPGVGHLWCHRIAEEIGEVAELVAVLVDETMTVAAGGTITDDRGTVLKIYEGRLPAVLTFKVPETAKSFTLELAGQRFTQPLPDDDH
jgi:hypothetical protein